MPCKRANNYVKEVETHGIYSNRNNSTRLFINVEKEEETDTRLISGSYCKSFGYTTLDQLR